MYLVDFLDCTHEYRAWDGGSKEHALVVEVEQHGHDGRVLAGVTVVPEDVLGTDRGG